LEQVTDRSKAVYTAEQVACERTVRKPSSERFEVKLPFKRDSCVLGLSFETAKRRFLALERRLASNNELHDIYQEFMREYLNLGHMSLLPTPPPGPHYNIPHQCVLRPDSSTTLMVGATIQRELNAILARFRLCEYDISADISKMYRQVNVVAEDRNLQHILWGEKSTNVLQTYRLNTITYGTAPAPFLDIRCPFELPKIYAESYPFASKAISSDFYVDDMLT